MNVSDSEYMMAVAYGRNLRDIETKANTIIEKLHRRNLQLERRIGELEAEAKAERSKRIFAEIQLKRATN